MKRALIIAVALAVLLTPLVAMAQPYPVPLSPVAEEVESLARWQSLGDGYTRSYDRRSEITSFYKEKPAPSPPKAHEWTPYVDVKGRAFWRKEDTHGWTFYAAREWAGLRFQDTPTFAAWHKQARLASPSARPGMILAADGRQLPANQGILEEKFRQEYKEGYLGNGQVEPEATAGQNEGWPCPGPICPQPSLPERLGIPQAILGIPTLLFVLGLTVVIGGLAMLVFFGLIVALIVWLCRRK